MNKRKLQGIWIAVFTLLVAVSSAWTTEAGAAAFKDVRNEAWYGAGVDWAVERGIVSGYGDGTFRPQLAVSEAEFLAMLLRESAKQSLRPAAKGEPWYAPYYALAKARSYPAALTGNRAKTITRGLAARWIAASFGKRLNTAEAIAFALEAKISNGVTSGTPEGFRADAKVSRAEAVTFVMRSAAYREQLAEIEPDEQSEPSVQPSGETGSVPGNGDPGGNPGGNPGEENPTRPDGPIRTSDNLPVRTARLNAALSALDLEMSETGQGVKVEHPAREGSGAILNRASDTSGTVLILDDGNTTVVDSAHALLQYAGVAIDKQAFIVQIDRVKQSGGNSALKLGNQIVTFVRGAAPGQMSVNYTLFEG